MFWSTCVCLTALIVYASNIGHAYTVRIVAVTMGSSYANWATSLYVTIWEDYVVVPNISPASREMISAYIGEGDLTV